MGDAFAVLDALGIEQTIVAGISTGAYALALAAAAPARVTGVIASCALTDMRWAEGRTVQEPLMAGIWDAPDRDAAIAIAEGQFGADGSSCSPRRPTSHHCRPPTLRCFADPSWVAAMAIAAPAMFAHGVQGLVDDRIADGVGWISFDVDGVRAATIVLHGATTRSSTSLRRPTPPRSCRVRGPRSSTGSPT